MNTRKRYEKSIKEEAVKIAKETSAGKASQNLGIPENTIRNWRRASERRPENLFIGSGRKYISSEEAKKAATAAAGVELLPMSTVKSIIFRWIFTYYNRHRIYSSNDGGYPPCVKREMFSNFKM